MEKVPVRDQGTEGICWAMATAQLLDAFRFSHSTTFGDPKFDHHTSAFQLAVLGARAQEEKMKAKAVVFSKFAEKNPGIIFGGPPAGSTGPGDVEQVVEINRALEEIEKNHGESAGDFSGGRVCPAFGLAKKYGSFQKLPVETKGLADFFEALDTVWRPANFKPFTSQPGFFGGTIFGGTPAPAVPFAMADTFTRNQRAHFVSCLYAEQGIDVREDAALAAIGPGLHKAPLLLLGAAQEDSKLPINGKIRCFSDDRAGGNLMRVIHESLDLPLEKAQPVALSICANFLRPGGAGYAGVDVNKPWPNSITEDCGRHALLAIGRRRLGGRCQILLRNSWGLSPNFYAKKWEARDGNVWVDEDALSNNLYEVQNLYAE
jgi:hypothetical protein